MVFRPLDTEDKRPAYQLAACLARKPGVDSPPARIISATFRSRTNKVGEVFFCVTLPRVSCFQQFVVVKRML